LPRTANQTGRPPRAARFVSPTQYASCPARATAILGVRRRRNEIPTPFHLRRHAPCPAARPPRRTQRPRARQPGAGRLPRCVSTFAPQSRRHHDRPLRAAKRDGQRIGNGTRKLCIRSINLCLPGGKSCPRGWKTCLRVPCRRSTVAGRRCRRKAGSAGKMSSRASVSRSEIARDLARSQEIPRAALAGSEPSRNDARGESGALP